MNDFKKCLTIFLCVISFLSANSQNSFLKEVNKLLDDYEGKISKLKTENKKLKLKINDLLDDKNIAEEKLSNTLTQYFITNEKLKDKKLEISELKLTLDNEVSKNKILYNENKKLKKKINESILEASGLESITSRSLDVGEKYEQEIRVVFVTYNIIHIYDQAKIEAIDTYKKSNLSGKKLKYKKPKKISNAFKLDGIKPKIVVDEVYFFETPRKIKRKEQRSYRKTFYKENILYICFELNLKHKKKVKPSRDNLVVDIDHIWYNEEGKSIRKSSIKSSVCCGRSSSHSSGAGAENGDFFSKGVYFVEIYINGILVSVEEFEVI